MACLPWATEQLPAKSSRLFNTSLDMEYQTNIHRIANSHPSPQTPTPHCPTICSQLPDRYSITGSLAFPATRMYRSASLTQRHRHGIATAPCSWCPTGLWTADRINLLQRIHGGTMIIFTSDWDEKTPLYSQSEHVYEAFVVEKEQQ